MIFGKELAKIKNYKKRKEVREEVERIFFAGLERGAPSMAWLIEFITKWILKEVRKR